MSKRSSLRVLLDTSFILPFLGFRTNREVMEAIPLLRECEVYYSELSILEALWKIVKKVRDEKDLEVVLLGLELLQRDLKRVDLDPRAVRIAVEMYAAGHRDMIDNLLYGAALSKGLRFLSVDEELRKFVASRSLEDVFIDPRDLRRELGRDIYR